MDTSVPPIRQSTVPHVGRERERDHLREAFDLATRGHGGLVIISGEPGIGKTTLAMDVIDSARSRGGFVLLGHCYDLTEQRPYGPWVELFASDSAAGRLPSLNAVLLGDRRAGSVDSQFELFEPVVSALQELASSAPLLLVIEDLQWADRASLDLLRYASRYAPRARMLILVTHRDDIPDQGHHLSDLLPNLIRETSATRVELQRLSAADIKDLVSTQYSMSASDTRRMTDYLYSRAEGNPFFTLELLRDLIGREILHRDDEIWRLGDLVNMAVPTMVRQVIASRLQRLDDETRQLLDVASVIGQEVPLDLLQEVSGASEEKLINAVEQAVAYHVAYETTDSRTFRFNHGLLRETIYLSKSSLRRRRQHRAVAEALARHSDPIPGVIAHHFALAEDPRAVRWLVQAGERALTLHAAQDAVAYLSQALLHCQRVDQEPPLNAYRLRAEAHTRLGEFDLALKDLTTILAAARASGDRESEWHALHDLGMLWTGKDYHRAGRHLSDALDLARELNDPGKVAHSINRVANWMVNTGEGDMDRILEMHQEALSIFEAADDSTGVADTLDLLGMTCFLAGNFKDSAAYEERAVMLARELNDKSRLLTSLTALAVNGGELDTSFDAGVAASRDSRFWLECCEEALAIAREAGWKSDEAFTLTMLATLVSVRGDPGQGLRLASEAHEIAQRIGHQQWITASTVILGRIWAELLDWHRSEYYLERGRATAQVMGSRFWTVLAISALANLQTEMGNLDTAYRLIEPFLDSEGSGKSNAQRALQFSLALWKLEAGEVEEALEIADALLALEHESSLVRGIPQILKLRGDALFQLDRLHEAEQDYVDALEAANILEYRSILWKIQMSYGSLLLKLGRKSDADDLFRSAQSGASEIARTIDDPHVRKQFLDRVEERIAPAATPEERPANSAGLSPREIEVLRLVAKGLSDAQVGEQLFISPRTVARHLQSIYNKLGVNSRTAATAFAYEHDLVS
jgi:ATP/maltotriose-dependent transcriptional regulator MalT